MPKPFFLYGDNYDSIRTQLRVVLSELNVYQDSIQSVDLYNVSEVENLYNQGTNLNIFSINSALLININLKVFKSLEKSPDDFISYLLSVSESKNIILILRLDNYDKTTKTFIDSSVLFQAFSKHCKCESFIALKYWQVGEIRSYILEVAHKYDIKFESGALDLFINCFKEHVEYIPAEISKLQAYLMPEKSLNLAVTNKLYSISSNADLLFERLITKNLFDFVKIVGSAIDSKNILYTVSILQNKARSFLLVKLCLEASVPNSDIVKLSGMHPYKAQKDIQFVKKLSTEMLMTVVKVLSEAEFNLKRGNYSAEHIMDNIFLKSA